MRKVAQKKPNISIFGPSGSGKTTSLRNLDPASTLILNVEDQALPFAGNWPHNYYFDSGKELLAFVEELKTKKEWSHIRVVVLDSFGAFNQQTYLREWTMNKNLPKDARDGWGVINNTNNAGNILLQRLRQASHFYSVVIGHDQYVQSITPTQTRIIKHCMEHPKGKEWEGKIERLFVMTFFATVKIKKGFETSYLFRTQSDGVISAKSPLGLFEDLWIVNDLREILNRCEEHWFGSTYEELISHE